MKCFYHPTEDSVAICSNDNKAICHGCVYESNIGMVCYDCAMKISGAVKKRLLKAMVYATLSAIMGFCWGFAAVGDVQGFSNILHGVYGILGAVIGAYWIGTTYLVRNRVLDWFQRHNSGQALQLFLFPAYIVRLSQSFTPFLGALIYGPLGGGIFEFILLRRIANVKLKHPQEVQMDSMSW